MASVKETLEMPAKEPSRLSRMVNGKSIYFALVIGAVIVAVVIYEQTREPEEAPSSVVNMGSMQGGSSKELDEIDPATQSALDAANKMAANRALANGSSSLKPEFRETVPANEAPVSSPATTATADSKSDALLEDILKTGQREEPIKTGNNSNLDGTRRNGSRRDDRGNGKPQGVDRFEAMERMANTFNNQVKGPVGKLAVVAAERRPDAPVDVDTFREGDDSTAMPQVATETAIRAYRSVYSKLITRATTDVPSPMIVELLEGPLKGARLEGRMAILDEGFAINFTQMEFDNEIYPVNALAVDPETNSPNVATEHKSRFWKKNVRLFASSFAQGWLGAVAKSGTTVVIGNGGSTTVEDEPDAGDALAAGGAEVAREISNDLRSEANRIKPMHGRPAETGLLIVFLSPVEMPKGSF